MATENPTDVQVNIRVGFYGSCLIGGLTAALFNMPKPDFVNIVVTLGILLNLVLLLRMTVMMSSALPTPPAHPRWVYVLGVLGAFAVAIVEFGAVMILWHPEEGLMTGMMILLVIPSVTVLFIVAGLMAVRVFALSKLPEGLIWFAWRNKQPEPPCQQGDPGRK